MAFEPVCVADFKDYARKNLPKYALEYFAEEANDENTKKENVQAYLPGVLNPGLPEVLRRVQLVTGNLSGHNLLKAVTPLG